MNSADDVTCLCEATLTARRTAGQNTGNLQIPLENLALRFASRVKSSLMYAQMLPLYLQRARTYAPTDYQSFPERPDRIHHMDLGFYRYFASSLSRYYRRRTLRICPRVRQLLRYRWGGKNHRYIRDGLFWQNIFNIRSMSTSVL